MEQITNEAVVPVFDGMRCPDPVPPGFTGCLVYIGGSSAAHVWDAQELARVAHLPRLPVWVPTPGQDNPRQAARLAADRLRTLGVPDHEDSCGRRPALMWDMETGTEPDAAWYSIAADYLWHCGYANLGYASLNVAKRIPVRSGIVLALPDGTPELTGLPGEVGHQYAFDLKMPGGTIDCSVFRASTLNHFWQP